LVEARIREAPNDPLATFLPSQIRNAFGEHTTPLPLAEKAVALDGGVAKYHRQLAARDVPDDPVPYHRAAERLLAAGRDLARAERYLRVYLAQEPEGNQPTAAEARSKLTIGLQTAAVRAAGRELVQ
jgi:hypothetical protein